MHRQLLCTSTTLLYNYLLRSHGRRQYGRHLKTANKRREIQCTWVQPEETCGAAEVLPGECWIFLKVINENVIQGLRHVDSIQNIWICKSRKK